MRFGDIFPALLLSRRLYGPEKGGVTQSRPPFFYSKWKELSVVANNPNVFWYYKSVNVNG